MINIIVAASEKNVIGKDNQMPWHLPADLKYFKNITKGNVVVMGRKTFESIGKPLPDRINIVITRQKDFHPGKEIILAHSVEEAIEKARQFSGKEIFIIGGAEIYKQSLKMTDRVYLTRIHSDFDGDTFLPILENANWQLVSNEKHAADEKNPYDYSFQVYRKLY